MNFPQPSQPQQPPPPQHNQPIQPTQPIIQRNSQPAANEMPRPQPPIPIINPNIQYPRYPQQVHPQPKINPKTQNNRRKNQKSPFPQPFPVNPQPSIDFAQPQLQMIPLKVQELLPERRELFFELIKEFPQNQQQYYQLLNELVCKFSDDKVYRYFREPRIPHVFKAVTSIKPIYYFATFSPQKEFKPLPKDKTSDVLYIASYLAFQTDPHTLKMMNLVVNNTNLPPLSFGEPDDIFFFRIGNGDKLPPSMILNMQRVTYNILFWLVVQAVRPKSPEEFISEYYSSKVKSVSSIPQKLPSKCPFCGKLYDALLMIKDIQRKGDSVCPSCMKRIPINQFIFETQLSDESPEKKKYRMRLFDIMQEPFLKEIINFDNQVCNSVFNFDQNQIGLFDTNSQSTDSNEKCNDMDNLNDYIDSMIRTFGDNAFD